MAHEATTPIAPPDLTDMKRRGERIVMVTAYDAPGARFAEESGCDLILVGDSAGNRVLGYESTIQVSMDEMIVLTAAVCRGASRSLVIADMPFGSYEVSNEQAVGNAVRFIKVAGASAVKLEGAGARLPRVRAIVKAGIPVMGHIGLEPQSATGRGGMPPQGQTEADARGVWDDALDLQAAGCFAVVLVMIPARVAARITERLNIPTIGIGAGSGCDGQVLVWHDLLGIAEGPASRFVKRYADLAAETRRGLAEFAAEVRSGTYPAHEHAYEISDVEFAAFEEKLGKGPSVKVTRPRRARPRNSPDNGTPADG